MACYAELIHVLVVAGVAGLLPKPGSGGAGTGSLSGRSSPSTAPVSAHVLTLPTTVHIPVVTRGDGQCRLALGTATGCHLVVFVERSYSLGTQSTNYGVP